MVAGRLNWRPFSFEAEAQSRCPLVALSGHSNRTRVCPLLEQQRTNVDFSAGSFVRL
jgi:hypothetical protein